MLVIELEGRESRKRDGAEAGVEANSAEFERNGVPADPQISWPIGFKGHSRGSKHLIMSYTQASYNRPRKTS